MSGRGERGDAGGDPRYVIVVCEGTACVPAVPIPDVPRAVAVGWLDKLAARFREKGKLGRVALLDGRTGAIVASRRVWP